jgi:hypothetical protein
MAVFWICAFGNMATAQVLPKVEGRFESDSVLIGDEVIYSLKAAVPPNAVVIFPDSGANFGRFVLKNFRWFPQKPLESGSLDSMVYTLSSFEEEGYAFLNLPVFELLPDGDTVVHFGAYDSVYVHTRFPIETVNEQLEFMKLAHEINYPYIVGGIFLALILVFALNSLLGRPLQRYWQLFLLWRQHRAFLSSFNRLKNNILNKGQIKDMEKILNLWKAFVQRITGEPYSTYTTRDIAQVANNESLIASLTVIDRWVYGGMEPEEKGAVLEELLVFSNERLQSKRRTIKHERKSIQRN